MLYIITQNVVFGKTETIWHIGDPAPNQRLGRVVNFQADGDELNLIVAAIKAASKEEPKVIDISEAKQIASGHPPDDY
jgi:hypothetical protein